MKNIVSFIFLLAMLVSGCSQEEMFRNGTSASEGRIFTTSFENDESRTYLEDGRFSRWTEGDRISLFDANTLNNQYLFGGKTGDTGGTFFMLSKPEGMGTALSANYAVYPYDKDMTISSKGVITLTLPSTQHYAENSYGLGDNTMVAVTENADDTFLQFKNVGGSFKLQLYGDDVTVKSITLKGNNGEKIAGKATLTPAYGKAPIVAMADDATTSITLDCSEKGVKIGATAEEATAFWVVIPPTAFEKGITITVKDMDGKVFTQTTDKQLVVERNVVKPMVAVKVGFGNLSEDEGLEYQLLNYEEDGVDAIITKEGLFAMIKQIPESTDYIFVYGSLYDENKNYILIDEAGFLKAIGLGENKIAPILYTSKSLLFLNSSGGIMYEFPYSKLIGIESPYISFDTRATYTRSGVFKTLELLYLVDGIIEKPVKEIILKLIRYINEGVAHRYGGMVSDLIDLAFDLKNITTWLGMFDRIEELCFFGNAKVTALEAIKEKVCTFKIPCKIEGLDPEPDFKYVINSPYYTVSSYNYTLGLIVKCDNPFISESYLEQKSVSGNCIESFSFNFKKLSEIYSYEPFLKVDLTYNFSMDEETYYSFAHVAPNAPAFPEDQNITHHKSCTIYGDKNSLLTGMVSSTVEEVRNPKMTSADVICSFSDVPSGAECQVVITQEGSEVSYVFSGQPDKAGQEVNVSGLSPSTSYVASSRIMYNGISYPGSKNVSFSTPGPSGQIISIDDIKRNSAVVKCKFTNVGSGVECGIIVTNNEGYNQKQTVSNTEGEQSVTISGLDPFTEYTCTPYVNLTKSEGGIYYKEGNSVTFKTLPPDLSGTWTCIEKDDSYSITLNKDGSASCSLYQEMVKGSWSLDNNGTLTVDLMLIATNDHNHGRIWKGSVDNMKNPGKITGYSYNWNFNHIGYSKGNAISMIMTR